MSFRPDKVVLHPEVGAAYDLLETRARAKNQPEAAIWKSFQTAILRIKRDGQWGEVIPRTKIPPALVKKYGITNLYCADLASFHRFFYTIRHRDVIVLDLVDHERYDELFRIVGRR